MRDGARYTLQPVRLLRHVTTSCEWAANVTTLQLLQGRLQICTQQDVAVSTQPLASHEGALLVSITSQTKHLSCMPLDDLDCRRVVCLALRPLATTGQVDREAVVVWVGSMGCGPEARASQPMSRFGMVHDSAVDLHSRCSAGTRKTGQGHSFVWVEVGWMPKGSSQPLDRLTAGQTTLTQAAAPMGPPF